ncbi:TetR family transcriptional regulator C-terminal domain-containing protein [Streptomyces subrutilus]|uniref:TetR family transcriptional regulator C-terminal domain-containing protein n=1 Tax=Streptomyces subrutilus TaxID=36818 RepID=UPI0009A05A2B|nr:TetR family transcriptional regulator C-terminal domain-containing protein [Streptomyces subrutilus]
MRAGAIFDAALREPLAESTRHWSQDTADAVSDAQAAGLAGLRTEPLDAAERLTALVEGLSERRLSGSLSPERARELLTGAVDAELGPRPWRGGRECPRRSAAGPRTPGRPPTRNDPRPS